MENDFEREPPTKARLDLQGATRRLRAINNWLDSPHPMGGVWLDHVDDAFMDAWDYADAYDLRDHSADASKP